MRQFAIGDIRGCLAALVRLDQEIQFRSTDVVVTLGEYVDRGPDSRGVIEFLIAFGERCQLFPLRGNHEVMMLRARDDRSALSDWVSNGGDKTLDSYGAKTFGDVPESHWNFLESTRPYHESARDFFVHANAYPDFALADQPDYMIYWEFLGQPAPHESGNRMICGHTAQKSGKMLNFGHAICIDTYAHGGGWLTCLETRTNWYWQSSQKGELRMSTLG